MKSMVTEKDKECPFNFNTDASTFTTGDIVCYRAPELLGDMPFIGELLEVHADHVVLKHKGEMKSSQIPIRASREDYPIVAKEEAMKVIN
ncbi:hypothetical protein R50073_42480 [Maricurvus nonylphenolicus]|uniref:hypothetical protein n=1 Tax=Maricurvus nonylphenolicus TaxID=1008307 RepID=UPI0036F31AC5